MMNRANAYCLFVLLFCSTGYTQITRPPELADGDRYRLIFVTSSMHDAVSPDVEVCNDFVQSVADASPLVGPLDLDWMALVSTPDVDARDNTQTNPEIHELVPIYMLDGRSFLLEGPAMMYSVAGAGDPRVRSINISEDGSEITGPRVEGLAGQPVFTGTNSFGVGAGSGGQLGGGELGGEGRFARIGDTGIPGSGGFPVYSGDVSRREVEAHFYAISEIITVPEPADISLFLIGVLFMLRKFRPTKDTSYRRRFSSGGIQSTPFRGPQHQVAASCSQQDQSCN